jgi:hypothetical protein
VIRYLEDKLSVELLWLASSHRTVGCEMGVLSITFALVHSKQKEFKLA